MPVALVRRSVRGLLSVSPAFDEMGPEPQREFEANLVKVGCYLVQPGGIRASELAGAITTVPLRQAGEKHQDLLAEVNFPEFVAGLIQGVFEAIVEQSIEQMEAYADLVKKVASTVDQFIQDEISDSECREWLAESYGDCFVLDKSGGLQWRCEITRARASKRLCRLGVKLEKLERETIAILVIPAARRRILASRQQLLATMVLMG